MRLDCAVALPMSQSLQVIKAIPRATAVMAAARDLGELDQSDDKMGKWVKRTGRDCTFAGS